MSTETGPDLSSAVEAITLLMDDTCELLPPGGQAQLNHETLELVQAEAAAVYSGRCKLSSAASASGAGARQVSEGAAQSVQSNYTLSLPLFDDAGEPVAAPERGQTAVVTSSRRSPALVGRRFRVTGVALGTFQVQWKAWCELREGE